ESWSTPSGLLLTAPTARAVRLASAAQGQTEWLETPHPNDLPPAVGHLLWFARAAPPSRCWSSRTAWKGPPARLLRDPEVLVMHRIAIDCQTVASAPRRAGTEVLGSERLTGQVVTRGRPIGYISVVIVPKRILLAIVHKAKQQV